MLRKTTEVASALTRYRDAGYPALAIETVEEERLSAALLRDWQPAAAWRIAARGGLRDLTAAGQHDPSADYVKSFQAAASREAAVLIVLDFQHVVRNPGAYRALRDVLPALKARGSMVLLIAPTWSMPLELEHEIPVIQWALPSREELAAALSVCTHAVQMEPDPDTESAALDAAAGLTLSEAEGAFALSLAAGQGLDRATIEAEKMKLLRSVAGLEVSRSADPSDVGGLGGLKEYIASEVVPAKDDPDLRVRGILLVGVPGTGKSLSARACGAAMQWPIVRLDLAACKGSLVGQSESNLRHALRVVDAIAPTVLWLDEIEKAVGGYASSAQTDSGVTLSLVGTLLTWLQEHTSPVIVIATCNDYSKLPAELTRAGRFDERFFVDLPTRIERAEIAAVHLRRYGCEPDGHAAAIADLSAEWTGAEIEALVRSAARRTRRALTREALLEAARDIRPISRVRAKEIADLRQWAAGALRLANTPEATAPTAGRHVRQEVRP